MSYLPYVCVLIAILIVCIIIVNIHYKLDVPYILRARHKTNLRMLAPLGGSYALTQISTYATLVLSRPYFQEKRLAIFC